jgi:hypothetical protein
MDEFTIEKALSIQREQLAQWKTVLKRKVYNQLCDKVIERNLRGYSNPDQVPRGSRLAYIIDNLALGWKIEELHF